ncbi:hypothetical protein CLOLEP_02658 [[Clostridium] leptum DSM 753]|uniref:Uncharacterized protein n=1 Tax=[Clostridium] leptum DSM 753 TaxID=428125 RepID=A7VVP6_9FIRM|nr:hypothetical protein CLOLEP_02658 [[Clostridium] leptum DSM 753]
MSTDGKPGLALRLKSRSEKAASALSVRPALTAQAAGQVFR